MSQDSLFDAPVSFNPRLAPAPTGETPSWFTPLEDFLRLESDLLAAGLISGRFDLDPCGHPEAPVSVEIFRRGGVVYFGSPRDNGLLLPWAGRRPFFNPPFDVPTITAFLVKFHDERRLGLEEGTLHCPAWTDRTWWQDHVEGDQRAGRAVPWFERGRALYGWPGNPRGAGGDTAKFPSVNVTWRRP